MTQRPCLFCMFRAESWPLTLLDVDTREELAKSLDGNIGFEYLAQEFGYRADEASHLRLRAQGNLSVQCSPTKLLLQELEGVTIQQMQTKLEILRRNAADIIPNNLLIIYNNCLREMNRHRSSSRPVFSMENTEQSFCFCDQCQQRSMQLNGQCHSVRSMNAVGTPPPPYSGVAAPPPSVGSRMADSSHPPTRQRHSSANLQPAYINSNSGDRLCNLISRDGCTNPTLGDRYNNGGLLNPLNCVTDTRPVTDDLEVDGLGLQNISISELSETNFCRDLPEGPLSFCQKSHPVSRCRSPICDNCRIYSDPDETKVLEIFSSPPVHCTSCSVMRESPIGSSEPDVVNNQGNAFSGCSFYEPELNESTESIGSSSGESLENKVASEVSENYNRHILKQNQLSIHNSRRKWCRNSSTPHRLGDMADCKTCKSYSEGVSAQCHRAIISRPVQISSENMRKSWPEEKSQEMQHIKSSSSDSLLSGVRWTPLSTVIYKRSGSVRLEETMYARVSSSSSSSEVCSAQQLNNDFSDIRRSPQEIFSNNLDSSSSSAAAGKCHCTSGQQNNPRSEKESDSSLNFYPNNLDCGRAEVHHNHSAGIRNIVQSDSFNGTRNNDNSKTCQIDCSHKNGQILENGGSKNRTKAFLTYSWNESVDEKTIFEEVCKLSQELHAVGIRVKLDTLDSEYQQITQNKLEWIDTHVREADFVVVCITPTYHKDIEVNDTVSPRFTQLNARYIFDIIRQEFYHNQSKNRRVIPVMFTKYGTTVHHVPTCMRSTLIYNYPDCLKEIIARIEGRGTYRPS